MRAAIPEPAKSHTGRLTGNHVPRDWREYMEMYWDYTVSIFLKGGISEDRVGDAIADFWEYMMELRDGLRKDLSGNPKPPWDILKEYDPSRLFHEPGTKGDGTAKFRSLHTKIANYRMMDARDKQIADARRSAMSLDGMPWADDEAAENTDLVRIMARHGQVYNEQLYRLRRSEFYRIIGARLAEVMPETTDDPIDIPLLFDMLMLQNDEHRKSNQKELSELAGIPVSQIKSRMIALRDLLADDYDTLRDLLTDDSPLIAA